tara:strand:- start:696 stop:1070 length:375 start_codon:yes stop_codon:yes gene_type:complete
MAIKKYRVAHGLESFILGGLIFSSLVYVFTRKERPNVSNNKEIVQLNKIFQEELKVPFVEKVENTVNLYKEGNEDEIDQIIITARNLHERILQFQNKCRENDNQDCIKKVDELIKLLGVQTPSP